MGLVMCRGLWVRVAFQRLAHSQNLDEVSVAEQAGTALQPSFPLHCVLHVLRQLLLLVLEGLLLKAQGLDLNKTTTFTLCKPSRRPVAVPTSRSGTCGALRGGRSLHFIVNVHLLLGCHIVFGAGHCLDALEESY